MAPRSSRDLFAGAICGVLTAAYCLSYAALIFAGPLKQWLSYGVAMTFLSAAVAAAVVAMRSSLPFAIAGPDASTSAVMAALVAAMVQHLTESGRHRPAGADAGRDGAQHRRHRAAALGARYYARRPRDPVRALSGDRRLLGATGWLMMLGAIQVVTDHRPRLEDFRKHFDAAPAAKLAAGLAVAIVLQLLVSRSNKPFLMLAILAVAVLALHVGDLPAPRSPKRRPAAGRSSRSLRSHCRCRGGPRIARLPLGRTAALTGDMLAVMFVTTISLLLNTTGVEIATQQRGRHRARTQGARACQSAGAAVGGYVSCLALGRTTLVDTAGATGRITGLTVAGDFGGRARRRSGAARLHAEIRARWLAVLSGRASRLSMAGQSARQLLLIEYLSLLAIAVIIIQWGFIAGVLIGVDHRLRHVRAERQPDQRHQVQLRRLGVPQLARPRRG